MSEIENRSHLLSNNKLLKLYQFNSSIALNNFLRGFVDKNTKEYGNSYAVFHEKEIEILQRPPFVSRDSTYGEKPYNPITTEYVSELIELDKVFELSRHWNKTQLTVFRGGSLDELKTGGNTLVSTSEKDYVAITFCDESNPAILKIELPPNSPYIFPTFYSRNHEGFSYEREVILPPCEYEVLGEWKVGKNNLLNYQLDIFHDGMTKKVKLLNVKVKPKSLAKTFLERMNSLPADYPKEFLEGKHGEEFKMAKTMLEEYIKNYVNTGLVSISDKKTKGREVSEQAQPQ